MNVNEADGGGADEAMMASLDPKKRKTTRIKIDPLMPRGGVAPNEWSEMENLEEGCRGVLVSFAISFHTPLQLLLSLLLFLTISRMFEVANPKI